MTLVVIDFRTERRLLLAARLGPGTADRPVVCVSSYAELQDVAVPRLALWHVGTAQDDHERGRLKSQLSDFLSKEKSWVAGYTAGNIPVDQLPTPGDHLVARDDAAADSLPEHFADAVDNVVAAWNATGGQLAAGRLTQVWLGVDLLLEAKLDFLATRLQGGDPRPASLETLKARYPTLDLSEAAVPPLDHVALTSVRDTLFHR